MSYGDIMPFSSPHGSYTRQKPFRLNASETFVAGEPVSINADGELTESASNPAAVDFAGIALAPGSNGQGQVLHNPLKGGPNITSDAYATGDMIPVVLSHPDQEWITKNYSAAGTAFGDAAPVAADLGEEAGLVLISGVWGIALATVTNMIARITDVLDADGSSIQVTGAAGVSVVFVITSDQWSVATAPAA